MAYVVPHIGRGLVLCGEKKGPLEAAHGHVVLLRVEAAETEVDEELCVVHSHLEETTEGEEGGGLRGGGGFGRGISSCIKPNHNSLYI